ncbi:MAG TPA: response regulator [Candidatus Dormibacteraeota bacterium]|nr:response regulator [Candidatus Dormibacteraeota bacterium]
MPKVMLVEDDNNLREIYQARLQAENYEIVSAKDGEEGLVIAKAEKPDLIIADVMMPKISGFEMLDILRNTTELKDVKVIMLTALGQNEDEQRAESLGADRYLVKSQVTLEDIVKAAQELLSDQTDKPAATASDQAAPAQSQPAVSIPVATEPPADDAAKDAQSTAQEEANAKSRIEDFVAGATEEATPAAAATNAADDDKLVADAAQALIDSTKDKTPGGADEAASDSQPNPATSSVPIAHKKVITPLGDNKPKQDINALLAAEEAKEAKSEPDDRPSGQAAATSSSEPPDNPANPGNIAL